MGTRLAGRSILSVVDLSKEEIEEIWRVAAVQKEKAAPDDELLGVARGRTLAMLFDKSSLRTRVSFEAAMIHLGGHGIYLTPTDIRMGRATGRLRLDLATADHVHPLDIQARPGERESLKDIGRVLGRYVDVIAARLSSQAHLAQLVEVAGVPVINAMSNLEHPLQAIADLFTIREHKGDLTKVEVAWVGDGYNVCHSLMLICGMFGMDLRVATPATYEPSADVSARAEELAKASGASLVLTNDPGSAVRRADVVYTDVWISSGMEDQTVRRRRDFEGFQVNQVLMSQAKSDAIVLHCLPAHRGEEITDEVLDGPQCAAFDQAENRLHTQRALLTLMFG